MEPYSNELLWIVIVGFIIAFLLAFGVGANDVANSFGTSVGSKVLTLRQACILATIFEILGAMLMGYKVSDTVRRDIFDVSMYANKEKELMMGNLAALLGSSAWNLLATFLRLPVSGTHSIVGAVLGFTFVARGVKGINWKSLGFIVSSWFISPVFSGIVSTVIFLIIRQFILKKEDYVEAGLNSLPIFYGFTILVNVFSIVHDGSELLYFDRIPWWGALLIAIVLGLLVGIIVRAFVVPRHRQLLQGSPNADSFPGVAPDEQNLPVSQSVEMRSVVPNIEAQLLPVATHDDSDNEKDVEFKSETSFSRETANKEVLLNDFKDIGEDEDQPEVAKLFSALQILTAIFGSFAHGGNDVSNAIAPLIALWIIFRDGNVNQHSSTPVLLLLYGGVGISVGLWVWGRKVIQTLGEDLTKITPSSGFTIEIGAATTVIIASKIGIPISTTHCKVGSVVFVGWTRCKKGVDWSLFRNIVLAWVITLPLSAALSAAAMAVLFATTV